MPLRKQKISIPLVAGIDTKSDPKQIALPHMADLQNIILDETSSARVRYPLQEVDLTPNEGGSLEKLHALWSYRDQVLMAAKKTGGAWYLYALKPGTTDIWHRAGMYFPCSLKHRQVVSARRQLSYADIAEVGGRRLVVHSEEDYHGALRGMITIYDADTGNVYLDRHFLNGGYQPQIHAVTTTHAHSYSASSGATKSLYLEVWDASSAQRTFVTTITSAQLNAHDSCYYEDSTHGNSSVVFWRDNSTGNLEIRGYDGAGTLRRTVSITGETTPVALTVNRVYDQPNSRWLLVFGWCDGTALNVRMAVYDESLTQVTAPTTITGMGSVAAAIAISHNPKLTATAGKCELDVYVQTTSGTHPSIFRQVIAYDGTGSSTNGVVYNHWLVSQAFTFGEYSRVIIASFEDALDGFQQSTWLMGRFDLHNDAYYRWLTEAVVCKDDAVTRLAMLGRKGRPVVSSAEDRVLLALSKRTRVLSSTAQGGALTESAAYSVDVDLDPAPAPAREVADGLVIGGGQLYLFDGTLQEALFYEPPKIDSVSDIADGSGVFSGGETVVYRAVYEWVDRVGRVHRSQPSQPVSHTVSSSGGPYKLRIIVQTYQTGSKWQVDRVAGTDYDKRELKIHLYRTTNAGTVHYKIDVDGEDNNLQAATVTIDDNNSDSDIQLNEVLYTTGGILENACNFACTKLAQACNRLFAVSSELPEKILPSKEISAGVSVDWNDALVQETYQRGDIYALAAAGESVVVFKGGAVYSRQAVGGPNNAGVGQFPPIRVLTDSLGIESTEVVVETPMGVLFRSRNGFHLASPAGLKYIGGPVEGYQDEAIVAGITEPRAKRVYMVTANGETLVWDYSVNHWYRWSVSLSSGTLSHLAASLRDGDDTRVYYLATGSPGTLQWMRERYAGPMSIYQDPGGAYQALIETPWINLGELSAYQRVWWIYLVGKLPHSNYRLEIFYDYESVATQTVNFSGVSGTTSQSSYRVMPARQRCQAIKLRLHDISGAALDWRLSRIELDIGTLGTRMKLKDANSYG